MMNNGAAGAAVAHPCLRAARAARAARIAGRPRAARAARAAAGHCRWLRHRIFRAVLLRGIDGQFTFRTAHGIRTLAFERGTRRLMVRVYMAADKPPRRAIAKHCDERTALC